MSISFKLAFKHYCAQIGNNALLIQGAGGNTSYKDLENDILMIKASGKKLANAESEEIFLPLSLSKTRALITENASDYSTAKIVDECSLRPSIETPLHALLPHKIVVHVHSVDVIAIAILKNALPLFNALFENLNWAWIPYVKPGPELANEIALLFQTKKIPDIIVLGNHGLVIGGDSLEEVDERLNDILLRLKSHINLKTIAFLDEQLNDKTNNAMHFEKNWTPYKFIKNSLIQFIAHDPLALKIIEKKWALYPDHVVFLGGIPPLVLPDENSEDFFKRMIKLINKYSESDHFIPAYIIIPHQGVFAHPTISEDCLAMLVCYAEVLRRISDYDNVVELSQEDIIALLNWDAEKYRQGMK